ncbi:tRNA(Ile)-lysidine synthase [Catalinimonas alkaloidigena]|uniref:tRNA lysidine(34) synthetase TilS n=1 Tax=Catalinimonas alkaloidigena TaxID=1075417 RepID=UPI002404F415|nr:tRNA lysidine(34) synthetase TilS [Catalinimonas alkaloidigena]MDF9795589.1 tRNA(Ile)-lysidine synthase [Catalinimonas alkaloidigena]
MVNKFGAFINETNLFTKNTPILLAVSGGVDSAVMADLFAEANFSFAMAHCNFHLRAEESDGDETFVRQLASQYGVECYIQDFDTIDYAEREKMSIEMAARKLRYAWFKSLLSQHNYTYVATAHHKNDVLETVLFNLSRGTGIAGLHGIKPKKGNVIRPLLFADRKQIENYAREKQLLWREDRSNQDEKHRRNLIRRKVIPVLEEVNPNLLQTMEISLERISETEDVFRAVVKDLRSVSVRSDGKDVYLNIKILKNQPGLKVILHELIKEYGFQYHQSREIAEAIKKREHNSQVGKVFDSSTHRLNIDRKELVISSTTDYIASLYEIDGKEHTLQTDEFTLNFSVLDAHKYKIVPLANIAALDHEKLQFPLKLRTWKKGDHFFPLGMNRKKKLSDFMIDLKIPLNLKKRVMVLTSGNDIVWVVGQRIDHRYRVTENTKQVFEIKQEVKPLP